MDEPRWHDDNPWAERVVYVPIEDLARCCAGGTTRLHGTDETVPTTPEFLLAHWKAAGDELDAYILPNGGTGDFSAGIRYGAEGGDYLSPWIRDHAVAAGLVEEHGASPAGPGPA